MGSQDNQHTMSLPPVSQLEYLEYDGRYVAGVQRPVINETPWVLYVNRHELVTFMCTPTRLHCLALGFLQSEEVISSLEDVWQMRIFSAENRVYLYFPAAGLDGERCQWTCEEAVGSIDVRLRYALPLPTKRILNSGCGGGITFDDLSGRREPLLSTQRVHAQQVLEMMQDLNACAGLYRQSRGVHTSGLYDPSSSQHLVIAEDIGRHNTLDKLRGECLLQGIDTSNRVLVTSGRISTEMIGKAYKMGVPIVASRTSPTVMSVRLAQVWNMTLVGYIRGSRLRVYTGAERILFTPTELAVDTYLMQTVG